MLPWFTWKGEDSRNMGLYVSRLPTLTRPEERIQRVTIPGRSGHLTIKEGTDIYNGFQNDCIITVPYNGDFNRILKWLTGHGLAVFSNDSDFAYEGDIAGAVKFDRLSNSLYQATIPFYFQPLKRRAIADPPTTITAQSATIYNPGNVQSAPKVSVSYTGSVQITIGSYSMAFTSLSESIIVDCESEIITKTNGELWQGSYSGDFWRISPGNNNIAVTKSGCTLAITPNWRWA